MYYQNSLVISLLLSFMLFIGCDSVTSDSTSSEPTAGIELNQGQESLNHSLSIGAGMVITQTNDSEANEVVLYARDGQGILTEQKRYDTGGQGTGSGLGSQGAVVLSQNNKFLFAVNAGSNEISVFAVQPHGLRLVDTAPTGGQQPISVTVHKSLVYVVHAGGPGSISGFHLSQSGTLSPISGSTQNLSNNGSGAAPGPAQIEFTPAGNHLVVTEKASNMIGVYPVHGNGSSGLPTFTASHGQTPFGFSFSHKNILIVSEAFGGGENLSATSSYHISKNGTLTVLSASVTSDQTAACWAVTTNNGKYSYISNTGSGSITGYAVDPEGSLALLDSDGVTAGTGGSDSTPIDMALSNNSQFLYTLNAGSHTITSYRVESNGDLSPIETVSIPAGSVGLIAK